MQVLIDILSMKDDLSFFTILASSIMHVLKLERVPNIYKITDVCIIFIVKEIVIEIATENVLLFFRFF